MEQPLFGLRMAHDGAGREDVADLDASAGQSAAHKQTAMAIERIGLGAHHRDPVVLRTEHELIEAGLKRRSRGHLLVVGTPPVNSSCCCGRPPSSLPRKT